jgi:hypothetical protein
MDKYTLSGTTLKRMDWSFFRIGEGIWFPTAHSIQFVACDNEVNITCLTWFGVSYQTWSDGWG